MIKANELRVGNYLQTPKGSVFQINTHDIVSIDDGWVPKTLLPIAIPLSEDILLRLEGFEKCINGYWDSEGLFNVKLIDGQVEIYLSGDDVNLNINDHIKYLHQLMNLYFALTGTELTLT